VIRFRGFTIDVDIALSTLGSCQKRKFHDWRVQF
jgi:hypothetical protein